MAITIKPQEPKYRVHCEEHDVSWDDLTLVWAHHIASRHDRLEHENNGQVLRYYSSHK